MLTPTSLSRQSRKQQQRAFTLAEVMMATVVFTMGILGVYMMMIKSYELVTVSRHRDNGRAVLLSYVDQFLRLQPTDAGVTRGIFVPHAATALGLTWTDSNGNSVDGNNATQVPDPNGPGYLPITLGDSGNPLLGSQVKAHLFREVTLINPADGTALSGQTPSMTAAGYMLQATFTIFYDISGRRQSQSITVLRSAR